MTLPIRPAWGIVLLLASVAGCGSATTTADKVPELTPAEVKAKEDIQGSFDRAYAAKKAGKRDVAIAEFTAVVEADPKNIGGYFQRGIVQYEAGEPRKAIDDYTKALELDPRHASSHYRRGDALASLKEFDKALADYDAAIRLDPKSWLAYQGRGIAQFMRSDADKAVQDLTKSLDLWPENPLSLWWRGLGWKAKGEWKKAVADLEAAIARRPTKGDTSYHHTLIWLLAAHPNDAARDGKRAVELAENAVALDNSWESRAYLAAAYAELGRFEDAASTQQKVAEDKSLPPDQRKEMERRTELFKLKMPLRSE